MTLDWERIREQHVDGDNVIDCGGKEGQSFDAWLVGDHETATLDPRSVVRLKGIPFRAEIGDIVNDMSKAYHRLPRRVADAAWYFHGIKFMGVPILAGPQP